MGRAAPRVGRLAVVIIELLPPNTSQAFDAMRELCRALSSREELGHARGLLEWLHTEADRLGCGQVHLGSEVGLNRVCRAPSPPQRGYRIGSHHFTNDI